MVSSVDCHPFPSSLASRYILSYFCKPYRAFSLFRMHVEVSLKHILPFVGKISKFLVFTFLENALNPGISTHVPLPNSKLSPQKFPQAALFSENLFPSIAERRAGNYDLFYQNSIRKYEDELKH